MHLWEVCRSEGQNYTSSSPQGPKADFLQASRESTGGAVFTTSADFTDLITHICNLELMWRLDFTLVELISELVAKMHMYLGGLTLESRGNLPWLSRYQVSVSAVELLGPPGGSVWVRNQLELSSAWLRRWLSMTSEGLQVFSFALLVAMDLRQGLSLNSWWLVSFHPSVLNEQFLNHHSKAATDRHKTHWPQCCISFHRPVYILAAF